MLTHYPRYSNILRNCHSSSPCNITLCPFSIKFFVISIFIFNLQLRGQCLMYTDSNCHEPGAHQLIETIIKRCFKQEAELKMKRQRNEHKLMQHSSFYGKNYWYVNLSIYQHLTSHQPRLHSYCYPVLFSIISHEFT